MSIISSKLIRRRAQRKKTAKAWKKVKQYKVQGKLKSKRYTKSTNIKRS